MITSLITILHDNQLEPTAEELADILWFTIQIKPSFASTTAVTETTPTLSDEQSPVVPESQAQTEQTFATHSPSSETQVKMAKLPTQTPATLQIPDNYPLYPHTETEQATGFQPIKGHSLKTPAATFLPGALELKRALRPLMRRITSRQRYILNEAATVEQIAEQRIYLPVLQGVPEREFEIALVIDRSNTMIIWQPTLAELRILLEHHGAFRNVRIWNLKSDVETEQVQLYADTITQSSRPHHPQELIAPSKRRLIWIVTDCISSPWYQGTMLPLLELWTQHHPVAIVQMLPQPLWTSSALEEATIVNFRATAPGLATTRLTLIKEEETFLFEEAEQTLDTMAKNSIKVPLLTLEPEAFALWARLVTGKSDAWIPGILLEKNQPENQDNNQPQSDTATKSPSAQQRIDNFYATASPMAQKLAEYLAAMPLTLPVMRLVQQVMLPKSRQIHLAEVFLGGLLRRISPPTSHAYLRLYDFHDGVRELLLNSVSTPEVIQVIVNQEISTYIEQHLGKILDFPALLADPKATGDIKIPEGTQHFARIGVKVLQRLGGKYGQLAKKVAKKIDKAIANKNSTIKATRKNKSTTTIQAKKTKSSIYNNLPETHKSSKKKKKTRRIPAEFKNASKISEAARKLEQVNKLKQQIVQSSNQGRRKRFDQQLVHCQA